MNPHYSLFTETEFTEEHRLLLADMLREQGKVQGDLNKKIDRCKVLCIATLDGQTAAVGAIKRKTASDFQPHKANLPDMNDQFEWELGYLYTRPQYARRGIASTIVGRLLESHGIANIMASTELSNNPGMVRILERNGFRCFGSPWKSGIHGDDLGLFLRFKHET